MPTLADHIADKNGVELARLSKLYAFPDFVKKADFGTLMADERRAVSVYADPVRRQYPCDNAASTWLSALYFLEKKAEFHPKDAARIQERLDHYVDYWRIKPAYVQLKTQHAGLHKEADAQLPDSAFAWVWTDEARGRKERRLRLKCAAEVQAACEWLHKYRDRIPYKDKYKIACRIKDAQAKFGAAIGDFVDFLDKQAGYGVCQPEEVVRLIEQRAYFARTPEQKEHIVKLAETVRSTPKVALQPTMLVKLAETVDTLDRALGLVKFYGDTLQRPEDVIFSATITKTAAELVRHVATSTGSVFEREALSKLALSDVRAVLGDEFADRVRTGLQVDPEKMASELGALPRPDAALVEGLLAERGIGPVLRKAASARVGFNRAQLRKMAEAY